jgi:hypothetical protein
MESNAISPAHPSSSESLHQIRDDNGPGRTGFISNPEPDLSFKTFGPAYPALTFGPKFDDPVRS